MKHKKKKEKMIVMFSASHPKNFMKLAKYLKILILKFKFDQKMSEFTTHLRPFPSDKNIVDKRWV